MDVGTRCVPLLLGVTPGTCTNALLDTMMFKVSSNVLPAALLEEEWEGGKAVWKRSQRWVREVVGTGKRW